MATIEGFRLSPQQKHVWLSQNESHKNVYRAWCEVQLHGRVETLRLRSAIESVVRQQEILRTVFQRFPGLDIPLQVIEEGNLFSFFYHDLREFQPAKQEIRLASLKQDALLTPLDVEHGLALCSTLVALASDSHVLFLCLPALCADVITLKNLVQDISSAYRDPSGREDVSIGATVQYADFAEWQNDLLVTEQTKIGRNYWLNLQAPKLLTASLPFIKGELKEAQEFHIEVVATSIERDSPILKRAEELASQYNLPLPVLFLACWQILLCRQMEQPDLTVGVAFDGRKQEDLTHAFGLFEQYLPLSYHLDEAHSFRTTLIQIHEQMQNMYKGQEFFSWDMIREAGWVGAHEPFAQVCFAWNSISPIQGADLSWTIQSYDACIDRFFLKLTCTHYPDRLRLDFYYDSACIVKDDVQRIVDQYHTFISFIINNLENPLDAVKILSLGERLQVVEEWSTGPAKQEQPYCIHHLFERQVEYTPYSDALVVGEQRLTYQETNVRANQLARYLQNLGVGPEVRVGLFVERSTDLIIGLLGILKAGGTYVPFDPIVPQVSLAFMLQDADVSIVLTGKSLLSRLPGNTCRILCLDSICEELSKLSMENTVYEVRSEQLAYIIFTSGSTGQPKGVAITHASLSTYTRNIMQILEVAKPINYAMVSTIAADLGNTVLFPSLCNGGCLHIIQQEVMNDPSAFGEYFQRHTIDCLKIVPSHLKALLTISNPERLLPRRVLILGGEATDWSFAQKIQTLVPDCQIINHYGPTETTVGALVYHLRSEQLISNDRRSATLPLGRPLGGVQCYVFDQHMQPVAVWVPGELYIGGAGVARGYLNHPELTAERFVPDPFRQEPGARLYRSGDRVRWLSDGTLEFLGRLDSQVKVRGFRIELGEVEVVLGRHPEVQEVVVVVREEEGGDRRLVAYLVPRPGQDVPTIEVLRRYAQQQLPEYMIPAAFVVLERLPLTANGKVDRRALPTPQGQRPMLGSGYAPSTTPTQELLVGIWQQVLRLEQVGIHDNFFALGGDSILSIQIVSRARQAGIHLTAKQLFQQPSIAQLVTVAQVESTTNHASQGLVQGEVPLTPIQHWFFEQRLPVPHHFNQALLLQTRRRLQASWLEQAVQALLWQHDALRLRFTPTATGWQQAYVGMQTFPERLLVRVDLAHLPSGQQREAVEEMVQQMQEGLHVQHGPLFRIALFDLGPMQPQRVALVVHHLVIDGVSWRIVLEDLQRAYEQRSAQQEVVLAAKTSSYQQWAQYLQTYVQHPQIQLQQGYWRRQRERAIEQRLVPERWQEGQSWAEARTLRCALSEPQTRALLQEVPRVYRTQITEVLVAALVMAWANWTGQAGVWVELEGHGREEQEEAGVDLTRTVGWFTTLYPVLIELGPSREPGAVLKQVKEQMRQIPQHGLGYGVLRYLGTEDREIEPEPAIRFNYLGQFDQIWSEAELWEPAIESAGRNRSVQNQGFYQLDISALISQEQLEITWIYNQALYGISAMGRLIQLYLEQLQALIDHCLSSETSRYTPSDFPTTDLSQHELDDLMDQLG